MYPLLVVLLVVELPIPWDEEVDVELVLLVGWGDDTSGVLADEPEADDSLNDDLVSYTRDLTSSWLDIVELERGIDFEKWVF